MTAEHQSSSTNKSVAIWLAAVLLGLFVLQIVGLGGSRKRQTPGPSRGDMVLLRDALPENIGEWTQRGFEAAPAPEELPKGQYWWVHQWQYANEQFSALVSCDQLGEDHWHELTVCYRGLGWSIHKRTEYISDEPGGGPYIVAELRKGDEDAAVLVFSVFYEDGTWAAAPAVDLSHLNGRRRAIGFTEHLWDRVVPIVTLDNTSDQHSRAIQCQVLVAGSQSEVKTVRDSAIQLHLASRNHFRSEWLAFATRNPVIPSSTTN